MDVVSEANTDDVAADTLYASFNDFIQAMSADDPSRVMAMEFLQEIEKNNSIEVLQELLNNWQEIKQAFANSSLDVSDAGSSKNIEKALRSINESLNQRCSTRRMSVPLADQLAGNAPGQVDDADAQSTVIPFIRRNEPDVSGSPPNIGKTMNNGGGSRINPVTHTHSFSKFFNTLSTRDVNQDPRRRSSFMNALSGRNAQYRLTYKNFGRVRLFLVGKVEVPLDNKSLFPYLFLHPEADARKFWNGFIVLTIAYFAAVLPIRIAFEQYNELSVSLAATELVFDSCFLVEILLSFLTLTIQHEKISFDFRQIAIAYLKGWFAYDVLTFFPYDIIIMSSGASGASNILRFVKVFRVMRIVRLLRLSKYVNNNNQGIRVLKSIGLAIASAHIFACLWIFTSALDAVDGTPSWIDQYPIPITTRTEQYITALYFVVATMCTVGFGDVSGSGDVERTYAICLMVFSVTMFAYFIGNISSILSGWGSAEADFKGHIRNLKLFMTKEDLPKEMQTRLLSYFDYCYRQYGTFPFTDPSITDDLSPALQAEVAAFVNKDIVHHIPVLQGQKEDMVRAILEVLHHQIYGPQDVIMHEGDTGSEMYFLKSGRAIVNWNGADGRSYRKGINVGDFFGEISLMLSCKRTATVTAISFCDVYVLSSEMFYKLMLNMPEFGIWIRDLVLKQNYTFKLSKRTDIERRWAEFCKMVDDLMITKFELSKGN